MPREPGAPMPSVHSLRYIPCLSLHAACGFSSRFIRSPSEQSPPKFRVHAASRDASANTAAFDTVDYSTTRQVCVSWLSNDGHRRASARPPVVIVAFGAEAATFCSFGGQDCAHRERNRAPVRRRPCDCVAQPGQRRVNTAGRSQMQATRMQVGGHDPFGQLRSGRPFGSIVLWQV